MGHYAFLDNNNFVVEVITGRNEDEIVNGISDWEKHYGDFRGLTCKRTSYNTWANQHSDGGVPFRGNYAGIGFLYDSILDAFIPPTPFASWVIDKNTFQWVAPISKPTGEGVYVWSELQTNWILLPEKPDASLAWDWNYETDQWVEFA
jgi:hypothetical protein